MKFSYSMIVSDRFDTTDFDERRQLFEMFDARGTLAQKNEEKVVHVSCIISLLPHSPIQISPWRCNLNRQKYLVVARLVIPRYGGIPHQNFTNNYAPKKLGA